MSWQTGVNRSSHVWTLTVGRHAHTVTAGDQKCVFSSPQTGCRSGTVVNKTVPGSATAGVAADVCIIKWLNIIYMISYKTFVARLSVQDLSDFTGCCCCVLVHCSRSLCGFQKHIRSMIPVQFGPCLSQSRKCDTSVDTTGIILV